MTENRSRADEPAWRHYKGEGKETEQQGVEKQKQSRRVMEWTNAAEPAWRHDKGDGKDTEHEGVEKQKQSRRVMRLDERSSNRADGRRRTEAGLTNQHGGIRRVMGKAQSTRVLKNRSRAEG